MERKTVAERLSEVKTSSTNSSLSAKQNSLNNFIKNTSSNSSRKTVAQRLSETNTQNNSVWRVMGRNYVTNSSTGNTNRVINNLPTSAFDKAKSESLGHETVVKDLGQALKGGLESWGANQLSTIATVGNTIQAIKNKDNYYEPDKGSTLWKLTQASKASTNYANQLMEDSKKDRGFIGSTLMDVSSQAVMNGIDAALSSIPGTGGIIGKISFASRSFGGTAEAEREKGSSIATQVLKGTLSASIEGFTESMSQISGVKNYLGEDSTGWLDGLYNKMEAGIASKLGPVAGKLATSFTSEGVEEMLSDILNPVVGGLLEGFTKNTKLFNDFEADDFDGIGNMLYDGLVGGISGIGGGIVESFKAVDSMNNEHNGSKTDYAKALRNEFESRKAANKGLAQEYNRLRKETNRKNAKDKISNIRSDYAKICAEVAENFAENTFANQNIDKEVLKQAAYKYLLSGEFDLDANDAETAKQNIAILAKFIIAEEAEKNTKGSKKDVFAKANASLYKRLFDSITGATDNTTDIDTENVDDDVKPVYENGKFIDRNAMRNPQSAVGQAAEAVAPTVETSVTDTVTPTVDTVSPADTSATTSSTSTSSDTVASSESSTEETVRNNARSVLSRMESNTSGTAVLQKNDESRATIEAMRAEAEKNGKKLVVKETASRITVSYEKSNDSLVESAESAKQSEKAVENPLAKAQEERVQIEAQRKTEAERHEKELSESSTNSTKSGTIEEKTGGIINVREQISDVIRGIKDGEISLEAESRKSYAEPEYRSEERKSGIEDIRKIETERRSNSSRAASFVSERIYGISEEGKVKQPLDFDDDNGVTYRTKSAPVNIDDYTIDDIEAVKIAYQNPDVKEVIILNGDLRKGFGRDSGLTLMFDDGSKIIFLNRNDSKNSVKKLSIHESLHAVLDSYLNNHKEISYQQVLFSIFKELDIDKDTFYDYVSSLSNDYSYNAIAEEILCNISGQCQVNGVDFSKYSEKLYNNTNFNKLINNDNIDIVSDSQSDSKVNTKQREQINAIYKKLGLTYGKITTKSKVSDSQSDFSYGYKSSPSKTKFLDNNQLSKATLTAEGCKSLSDEQLSIALSRLLKVMGVRRSSSNILETISSLLTDIGELEDSFGFSDAEDTSYYNEYIESIFGNAKDGLISLGASNYTGKLSEEQQAIFDKIKALADSNGEYATLMQKKYDSGRIEWLAAITEDILKQRAQTVKKSDLSVQQRSLLNIITAMDERGLDINKIIKGTKNKTDADVALEKQKDIASAEGIDLETEYRKISDQNFIDFDNETVTDAGKERIQLDFGADADNVIDMVNTLISTYSDGFPKEEAVNLRNSLMSGFAPADEFGSSNFTLGERLDILKLAFPASDFSISRTDSNTIVENTYRHRTDEAKVENDWDKQNLDRYTSDDSANTQAFGYIPVDESKNGWVTPQEVSVEDKVAAQKTIEEAKNVSVSKKRNGNKSFTVLEAQAKFDRLQNQINYIKSLLQSRLDNAVSEKLENYKEFMAYMNDVALEIEDILSYPMFDVAKANELEEASEHLRELRNKQFELREALLKLNNKNSRNFKQDRFGRSLNRILDKTISESLAVKKELSRQLELVKKANQRKTITDAFNDTWIDKLSYSELSKLISNYYWSLELDSEHPSLTDVEIDYAEKLFESKKGEYNPDITSADRIKNEFDNPNWKAERRKSKNYGISAIREMRNTSEELAEREANANANSERATSYYDQLEEERRQAEEAYIAERTQLNREAEAARVAGRMTKEERLERMKGDLEVTSNVEYARSSERQKLSDDQAWDNGQRLFGKGHKFVTSSAEALFKLKNTLKDAKEASLQRIANKIEKIQNIGVDVNNGYASPADLADEYSTWQNGEMKQFYGEELDALGQKLKTAIQEKTANGDMSDADQQACAKITAQFMDSIRARIKETSRIITSEQINLVNEAKVNGKNIEKKGTIGKLVNWFTRMQGSTDTMLKAYGGFKEDSAFYKLGQRVKDSVAKRMTTFVNATSYFNNVKDMEDYEDFAQNKTKVTLKSLGENGTELGIQDVVTMYRRLKSVKASRNILSGIEGFAIQDKDGNVNFVSLGVDKNARHGSHTAAQVVLDECKNIINSNPVAKAYNEACDEMFETLGVEVDTLRKKLTGIGLTRLAKGDYTPVRWASKERFDNTQDLSWKPSNDVENRLPGFLQERTNADDYLVVSAIGDVVDRYITSASDYIGTASLDNELKVLSNGSYDVPSVSSALAENFGKQAGTWFDEYVKDLTMHKEGERGILAGLRAKMAGGVLVGSPSVIVKQSSSFWASVGILSPEAVRYAYRNKLGFKTKGYSEFNPLLKNREITNNIDPTLSAILKDDSLLNRSKAFQLFTHGIEQKDFVTVEALYTATLYDVAMTSENSPTSDAFAKEVDDKFMEVMFRSQPMFDTELRSENQRTDNELIRLASMFRTQQTQNLNLIASALGEYQAYKGTDKAGKKLQVLKNTAKGQIASAFSLSILTVVADVLLHSLRKYRDDDDEIDFGKVVGRIGLNAAEFASSLLWGGDYLMKKFIDIVSGGETKEFYGINLGPLTMIEDLFDSIGTAVQSPTPSNIKNCVTYGTQILGIPANNVYRLLNSAAMYFCDITGNNRSDYDDILKMWHHDVSVNEKNKEGQIALIEAGMSKRESTELINSIDVNNNGLAQKELKQYYIDNPDSEQAIASLWEALGFDSEWDSVKKSADKTREYNSNPLYADIDTDSSKSVSQDEVMSYYLDHQDSYDDLKAVWDAQGWSSSFDDAISSFTSKEAKTEAQKAFEDGDYNALFEALDNVKNGKTALTGMIKEETNDYDSSSDNLIVNYLLQSNVDSNVFDNAIMSYTSKSYAPVYEAARSSGMSPKSAVQFIDTVDTDDNNSLKQQELLDYYVTNPKYENVIIAIWNSKGYKKTWDQYKKSKKVS